MYGENKVFNSRKQHTDPGQGSNLNHPILRPADLTIPSTSYKACFANLKYWSWNHIPRMYMYMCSAIIHTQVQLANGNGSDTLGLLFHSNAQYFS